MGMRVSSIRAVFQFEWRRSWSPFRIVSWTILALFTPALFLIVSRGGTSSPNDIVLGMSLFFLVPEATCLLALLLWATPSVFSELESHAWLYLAARPNGPVHMLLGKYLNALVWTFSAALASITLTAKLGEYYLPDPFQWWVILASLAAFSTITYGALFCLFAVIWPKRSMVLAVVYIIVFEFLVSFLPATINRLTVQFRLRSLLVDWMGWRRILERDTPTLHAVFGDARPWLHALSLLAMAAFYLGLAGWLVSRREYLTHVPD